MNPSDLFKASLGTAASAISPVGGALYNLGNSLFGNSTPKQSYSTTLSSSAPSSQSFSNPSLMSTVPKTPASSTGGNASATSPKTDYINSQTGLTGSTAPTNASTGVNPNYGIQIGSPGATPPGNIDQNSSQYKYQQAFDSYLKTLQPSDSETSAAKTLADLQLQSQKDNEQALNSGETLGFASGEAARVNKNNQFGIDAASNALNALTNSRNANTTSTKAQLDFEKGLYDDSVAAAKPDYTTVSPGSTVFDPKTGKAIYTAPTTASQTTPASSSYIAGTDPTADGWVTAINNNQAKLTDVPAAYKSIVAQGLAAAGKDDALKTNALTSAQQLLQSFDNSGGFLGIGGAKQAVGASSVLPVIPGTPTADFVANIDNLKSLLSLDNVKYLKGQGAVSDAERKLLADSATQLSRSQSEPQFRATLQKIIDGLNKFGALGSSGGGVSVSAGGQTFTFPDQASADAFSKEAGL